MMNCDEFKQAVLTEPAEECADRREHADNCPDCTELLRKVMLLEQRLNAALAVTVPAVVTDTPLADFATPSADVVADNVVALAKRKKWQAPVWFAAAACVALVALFVLRQPELPAAADGAALAAAVVDHVEHEWGEMRVIDTAVGQDKIRAVLSPVGSTLDAGAPLVSYVKSCVINGQLVPHLVMQGQNGPVTVLLMPSERVDGPISIMRDGVEGVILPVGASGSIAILGRDAASVESVRNAALDAVEFSI